MEDGGEYMVDNAAEDDAPLALLADLTHPTSDRLVPRVLGGVDRGVLISTVLAGIWFIPVLVFLQFICLGLELLAPKRVPLEPNNRG